MFRKISLGTFPNSNDISKNLNNLLQSIPEETNSGIDIVSNLNVENKVKLPICDGKSENLTNLNINTITEWNHDINEISSKYEAMKMSIVINYALDFSSE